MYVLTWYLQAMRDTVMSLAKERQQTQEPVAAAERVRRMSACLLDRRRASRDWRSLDSEHVLNSRPAADRRRSVLDLMGNIDEGLTALSWSVYVVFLRLWRS